ncbi:MAG: ABC transporter ATP-binding protein, partial [Lachnospiraceae bacterium]|nr:ABC transporter ATP-binding protein [Lachnospiraceae bacterium]
MSIIEVKEVKKSFGKGESYAEILKGASFSVEKGEFVSLMGASGSGKSTMLYLIGGLDREFEGEIKINDEDIAKKKEKELSKLRLDNIGFVFQFYNLVQNLTVEDNIMLPIKMSKKNTADAKKRLDEILELTGLTEKRKSLPRQLSGGQQQRVAIARAILGEPEILLADEPTGNLDSSSTEEIMQLFRKINKEKNITILQVTHSEHCASFGDRVI